MKMVSAFVSLKNKLFMNMLYTSMNTVPNSTGRLHATLLFSLMLLFFLQLYGLFIESIYRMVLIKLAPGVELFALLFLFLPLLIFLVKEKHEQNFLFVTVGLVLICRLLCPLVDAPFQIVFSGLGMAMFLIFLAYATSTRHAYLSGDVGIATGLALLLAVAFRNWGSSLDISLDIIPIIIGVPLILLTGFLSFITMKNANEYVSQNTIVSSNAQRYIAAFGFFSAFAFVYLLLSCPDVIRAWAGYSKIDFWGILLSCTLVLSVILTLLISQRKIKYNPFVALLWNLLFTGLLVTALWIFKPALPTTVTSPPIIITDNFTNKIPLQLSIFLLSGVVLINIRFTTRFILGKRPKNAQIPILAGMFLLFGITMLLIATNIWGYLPYGSWIRNRFFLPFLIAGIGMMLPWIFLKSDNVISYGCTTRLTKSLLVFLSILVIVGELVRYPLVDKVVEDTNVLTVVTYNMQQGTHDNGNRNYTEQCAFLREINADIIGLQECDTARPSGGNVDTVRYFAEAMNYDYVYYGPNSAAGTFGTAILSRYPIKNSRTLFSYSYNDEIGTACCDIDVSNKKIGFFCCHPAGIYDAKNAFVTALLSEVEKYTHVIAVGDFNFREWSPHYKKVSKNLINSAAQLGIKNVDFHCGRLSLSRKIDHIFFTDNFQTVESHYLSPPLSQTDHPAHWSVIKFQ